MADAETILLELIDKIASEKNYQKNDVKIKAITSGGANYTSVLFLVTLKSSDKKDIELFAKVACVGEKLRDAMNATRLYYLETFFYNELSKTYKELELKRDLFEEDKFLMPKFYGCSTKLHEETVVLENLVAQGYGSYSRFESVDWGHAASSIEALAKFHALSFAYQKSQPEEFQKVCEDLVFIRPVRDDSMKALWGDMVQRSLSIVKEEYRPKILSFLENVGEDGVWKFRYPLGKKVIIHGDYRPSNMLYKKLGDKVLTIPVDYQTIHVGSPAADFIYFELTGTDSNFRAEHHDRLVDHYHAQLSKALQRLGVDVTEVYPRDVFDEELKEMLPFTVLLGIFLLPIVLVEAEKAPSVNGEGGLESFIVPSNDLYAERFAGIVEDCVRWGVL